MRDRSGVSIEGNGGDACRVRVGDRRQLFSLPHPPAVEDAALLRVTNRVWSIRLGCVLLMGASRAPLLRE